MFYRILLRKGGVRRKNPIEHFFLILITMNRNALIGMMINIIEVVSGFLQGFYRGYCSTILREIPFSVIQFPLWECCKVLIVQNRWNEDGGCYSPLQSTLCGAVADAFLLQERG
jgi:hypothetical protein